MNTLITAGPKGLFLHVNQQFIAQNAKDGGSRPVFTLKPDGPNSKPIYAREVIVHGRTTFVNNGEQLTCGARVWVQAEPGTVVSLKDAMDFSDARTAPNG